MTVESWLRGQLPSNVGGQLDRNELNAAVQMPSNYDLDEERFRALDLNEDYNEVRKDEKGKNMLNFALAQLYYKLSEASSEWASRSEKRGNRSYSTGTFTLKADTRKDYIAKANRLMAELGLMPEGDALDGASVMFDAGRTTRQRGRL